MNGNCDRVACVETSCLFCCYVTTSALRGNIRGVRVLNITANDAVHALLSLARNNKVCILDSCGIGHLGSHLMIGGIRPTVAFEGAGDPTTTLAKFEHLCSDKDSVGIFTLSYDLGRKIIGIESKDRSREPDLSYFGFNALVVHDYRNGSTFLTGNESCFDEIEEMLSEPSFRPIDIEPKATTRANFDVASYCSAIESIKELIRDGETYQTNLTQKISVRLHNDDSPEGVFSRLRRDHPAPFAAFLKRNDSSVVSASPERFFRVSYADGARKITASPIKGTRRRGANPQEDERLRNELLSSDKDRAENTMIVDLLRNDLGRVCEYGSVVVEKLCEIEEHPTLFHLVSTISGTLSPNVAASEIIAALFPCGSITGAPKERTMKIIDEIEPEPRGLSMGAIGIVVPQEGFEGLEPCIDLNVAIRTMVIRDDVAEFNVGGGVVIDSDPMEEYRESLLKARALISALGAKQASGSTSTVK